MNTIQEISTNQLQDASGQLDDAVSSALGGQRQELYDNTSQELPRPEFAFALIATYGDEGIGLESGFELDPEEFCDLEDARWHNMRIALGRVSLDNRVMWFPATVLPGGKTAYLETDAIQDTATHGGFSDVQHLALDNAFLAATSSAGHGGTTNAAESRHGIILASQTNPYDVHGSVHEIDDSGAFDTTAGIEGVYDIGTRNGVRHVRPRVTGLNNAFSIAVRPEFQLAGTTPFGLAIPPQQLLIAGTLAAVTSRGNHVNVPANITEMVQG